MTPFSARDAAPSLWAATARPAPLFPVQEGDIRGDVVIIGGGYTGLSAAHYLAANGEVPVVLEGQFPGWGASGRNGGVITARFRRTFPAIAASHGHAVARRMYRIAQDSIEVVEEFVRHYDITDAQFSRSGQIKAAHNEKTLRYAVDEAAWLRKEVGDTTMSVLSAGDVRQESGSDAFVGGVLNAGSGSIHPLNYVRGFAEGIARRGIPLFADSPALSLTRDGDGMLVQTPRGTVRARQAIIATNSYSDLTGATSALQRTVVPFRSAMIATERLAPELAESLLSTGRSFTETKRMMRWFRKVDDRILFGGRGAFGKSDSPTAFKALRTALVGIFPQLAGTSIAFQWSGLVAMTMDAMPHVGRVDERVLYANGYNGAGVAMSSLVGGFAAALALGEEPDLGLLAGTPPYNVPFYPLRQAATRTVAGWYQFLDAIGR